MCPLALLGGYDDNKARQSDLLDGLRRRGFKLTMGEDDSGFLQMAWQRGGGYYLGDLSIQVH
jgi:hypothetical protein